MSLALSLPSVTATCNLVGCQPCDWHKQRCEEPSAPRRHIKHSALIQSIFTEEPHLLITLHQDGHSAFFPAVASADSYTH